MGLSDKLVVNNEVVYTPWGHTGFRPSVWVGMFRELWLGRGLIWRLFLRDISAQYRQSVFGYVWAVAPAIVTTLVFSWLRGSGTLPIGETPIAYPAFALLGITVWQLFSTGLIKAAQSLSNARAIIVHINFSRETLVVAAFGQSVFNFLVRLVPVIAVFVWYGIIPKWTTIFVPVILVPLALMTVGFGFILALANGIFRDIGNSLTLILTFAMFAAPVLYPPPTEGLKVLLNYLNPASPFIIAARDLVITGRLSQPYGLFWMSLLGVVVFLAGWRIFHLAMARVAERV